MSEPETPTEKESPAQRVITIILTGPDTMTFVPSWSAKPQVMEMSAREAGTTFATMTDYLFFVLFGCGSNALEEMGLDATVFINGVQVPRDLAADEPGEPTCEHFPEASDDDE